MYLFFLWKWRGRRDLARILVRVEAMEGWGERRVGGGDFENWNVRGWGGDWSIWVLSVEDGGRGVYGAEDNVSDSLMNNLGFLRILRCRRRSQWRAYPANSRAKLAAETCATPSQGCLERLIFQDLECNGIGVRFLLKTTYAAPRWRCYDIPLCRSLSQ